VYKYEEALKCLERAKELNPGHSPISIQIGEVYMKMDTHDEAEIELTRALKDEQLSKKDRIFA